MKVAWSELRGWSQDILWLRSTQHHPIVVYLLTIRSLVPSCLPGRACKGSSHTRLAWSRSIGDAPSIWRQKVTSYLRILDYLSLKHLSLCSRCPFLASQNLPVLHILIWMGNAGSTHPFDLEMFILLISLIGHDLHQDRSSVTYLQAYQWIQHIKSGVDLHSITGWKSGLAYNVSRVTKVSHPPGWPTISRLLHLLLIIALSSDYLMNHQCCCVPLRWLIYFPQIYLIITFQFTVDFKNFFVMFSTLCRLGCTVMKLWCLSSQK